MAILIVVNDVFRSTTQMLMRRFESISAQVVETKAEAKKKKPVERKKSTSDEPKAKRFRKAKDEKKSPASNNKPKRPLTAFFIFMNDFRKTFKEENPSSNVKDVS
ncbi:High mobility group B protein 7 [Raphanus sativus]|nr:High mobility group B protein 7 [Raphanus sativus]